MRERYLNRRKYDQSEKTQPWFCALSTSRSQYSGLRAPGSLSNNRFKKVSAPKKQKTDREKLREFCAAVAALIGGGPAYRQHLAL